MWRWQRSVARVAGQGFFAALLGLGVGAPFGLVAGAIGFSLRGLRHDLLGVRLMREATGLSLRQQLAPAVRPVVAVIAMAAAMLAARYALEDASFGAAGILAGCLAAGLADYAAALMVVARRHFSVILFEIRFLLALCESCAQCVGQCRSPACRNRPGVMRSTNLARR
jgi:hypothetical protein